MTEEQFNALAPYEPNFKTSLESAWCRYPGVNGVKTMHSILVALTGDRRRLNTGCANCVLHLVQDVGRLYFEEKARREAKPNKAKKNTAAGKKAPKNENK